MHEIRFKPSAKKELNKLPNNVIVKIITAIKALALVARPDGCKKLKSEQSLWRIRVGDYRVIYSIDDVIKRIDIRKISHRKDAY